LIRFADSKGTKIMDCKEKSGKDCKPVIKKTVADLNAANFKNKDVMKWTKPKASAPRKARSSSISGLGQLGRTTRIPRLTIKQKK
tara:strand:- start:343 stop:597 length:255 start_codon:yes stop_codon:yes gene_type:complete